MLRTFNERREQEEGFTLIELMVVVLIIAILLAIAIPTFLGARERANDRAAQSSLRNALTAAKTLYTDSQDYSVATAASLPSVEPSLTYSTAASGSSDFKIVAVDAGTSPSNTWIGAAKSKSGTCYVIMDVAGSTGGGTFYAKSSAANCSTTSATPSASTSW